MDISDDFNDVELEEVLENIDFSKDDLGFWDMRPRLWLSLKNMSGVSGTTDTREEIAKVLYYGLLSNYKSEKKYLEGNFPDSFKMRDVFGESRRICRELYERFDLETPERYNDIAYWDDQKVS